MICAGCGVSAVINVLFLGVIVAPALAALLLPLRLRRETPHPQALPLVIAAGVSLCLMGLLAFTGETPAVAFSWLPGMGEMRFALEQNGLLAALATAAALTGALWASRREKENPWLLSLMLLALAAANAAFLSAHFLARYVALEVVGLAIALALLVGMGGLAGLRRGSLVYLLLRVGDAGLLAAILLLHARTGTLEIGPALAAAPGLGARAVTWMTAGFALAVAVKVGLLPFQIWILAGQALPRPVHLWLYSTVMPNLGLYLLYRIAPLAALPGPLNTGLLWVGALTGLGALGMAQLRPRAESAPFYVLAAQGGLALLFAAGGAGKALPWGILIISAARMALWSPVQPAANRWRSAPLAGGALALFWIWALATTPLAPLPLFAAAVLIARTALWALRAASPRQTERVGPAWLQRVETFDSETALLRFARRLRQVIEVGALERSLEGLAQGLMALAQAMYERVEVGLLERGLTEGAEGLLEASEAVYERVELAVLERGVAGGAAGVLEASDSAYEVVEQEGLEGSLRSLVGLVRMGTRWLHRRHRGRLRANLVWVAVALVSMVVLLVAAG